MRGPDNKWRRWLPAAFLFLIYSGWCFLTADLPRAAFFGGDSWEYQAMAVNFAKGHGLRMGALEPFETYAFDGTGERDYYARFMEMGRGGGEQNFYRTPAYPFLLGVLYRIAGVRPDAAAAMHIFWLALVGALLPVLAFDLLGWRGAAAGLVGGAVFVAAKLHNSLDIMTEPLIALACCLTLAAWAFLNRGPSWPKGALFGLVLASDLFVKGSLAFVPLLFLGYMVVRAATARAYRVATVIAAALAFTLPVAAWSVYASQQTGRPVFMSTQGAEVLLDGNNEYSLRDGGWCRQWRDDPTTYYRRAGVDGPEKGSAARVIAFYRERPDYLPRILYRKLAAFDERPVARLLMALCFLWTALTASRALLPAPGRRMALMALLAAGLAASRAAFPAAFLGSAGLLMAGCLAAGFRGRLRETWAAPGLMGPVLLLLNFLLLCLIAFTYSRFLWPAYFIALLMSGYLLIRLAEEAEAWPGVYLLPRAGSRSVAGWLYASVRRTTYRRIADEIALLSPYFDRLYYVTESPDDALFPLLRCGRKTALPDTAARPDRDAEDERCLWTLNGLFNCSLDIQGQLQDLKTRLRRGDRVAAALYNPYLRWLYEAADAAGLRRGPKAVTFVTQVGLESVARLAGYEVARLRPAALVPFCLLGLGTLADRVLRLLPGVRRLALVDVAVLRPIMAEARPPSLSVIVPARNERGNIQAALDRLPPLPGVEMEVIFVEGHSTDGTWEEIERVAASYSGPIRIRTFRQEGRGKADAVRLGFGHAAGHLVTILDADLTMPPELLGRFYDAYCQGLGDFVNGNRLLYPMEGEAMRFLNRLGNVFFAKALSWVLDQPLGDTLCGTKLLARRDYERMRAWRADFGDFDPFGDFELLFPAAVLGLGVVEVPIRYRDRTYGVTNIHRFRHGWQLLRMTLIGLARIKMGFRRRT